MTPRPFVAAGARALFAGLRRARHAWLAAAIPKRVTRTWRRSAKRASERRQRIARLLEALRQLTWYDVPGERRRCPACSASAIQHLQVLGYTRPLDRSRRYGFISGCEQCGVVFANPLPSAELLGDTYTPEGRWGQTRPDHEPPVSRSRLVTVFTPIVDELDVLNPPAGAAVVDFGCGLGGMLDSLKGLGWETYGVDPGTKAAFDRHQELPSLPYSPRFNLAILHHVLEHVIDPSTILHQLARATRVGGFLLVSVPNLDRLLEHGDLPYCIRSNTHVLAYSRSCLMVLLARAGFRVLEKRDEGSAVDVKRQVVLARREDRLIPEPPHPLAPARAVLDAFVSPNGSGLGSSNVLPVRMRAAIANLRRTRVLKPASA